MYLGDTDKAGTQWSELRMNCILYYGLPGQDLPPGNILCETWTTGVCFTGTRANCIKNETK